MTISKFFTHISALVFFSMVTLPSLAASSYNTTTFLSKIDAGNGAPAGLAYIDQPQGFATGPDHSIFIADTINNVIKQIDKKGKLTIVAGNDTYGYTNGAATQAQFANPSAVAVAADGTVFVADTSNNVIRKISNGVVSTYFTDVKAPLGLNLNGNTLFVSDTGNGRIIALDITQSQPSAVTFAHNLNHPTKLLYWPSAHSLIFVTAGTSADSDQIRALNLSTGQMTGSLATGLKNIGGITLLKNNLFVASSYSIGVFNEIWRVHFAKPSPTGNIKTLTQKRISLYRETEQINLPSDILVRTDKVGKTQVPALYVLYQGGSSIIKWSIAGKPVSHYAGKHRYENEFGPAGIALTGRPQALAFSHDGTKVYISQNNLLTVYNLQTKRLSLLAGDLKDSYAEGKGPTARFSNPTAIAISPDDKWLYVVDRNNNRIRKINTKNGKTVYLTGAGTSNFAFTTTSGNGYQEGKACATEFKLNQADCAYFYRPTGIAVSPDGKTLYIADASNNRVRAVNATTGQTSLIAGNGSVGLRDGAGSQATFNGPYSIALSDDGKTLYVADKYNNVLRAINLSNNYVSTILGKGATKLSIPEYITQSHGIIYWSEAGSNNVRQFNLATKSAFTISGTGKRGFQNGAGSQTKWNNPKGLATHGGQLFVADYLNDLVRAVQL